VDLCRFLLCLLFVKPITLHIEIASRKSLNREHGCTERENPECFFNEFNHPDLDVILVTGSFLPSIPEFIHTRRALDTNRMKVLTVRCRDGTLTG
jgi:hypothetical protein